MLSFAGRALHEVEAKWNTSIELLKIFGWIIFATPWANRSRTEIAQAGDRPRSCDAAKAAAAR
jgi:hypothetical protein